MEAYFNSDLTTWPTDPDRQKDYAMVSLQVNESKHILLQLTIEIQETSEGGIIKMGWDDVWASTSFEIEHDQE